MQKFLALLSTIVKDVGLGVALFLASALLYTANKTASKFALIATCPLLFYGYAVRLNAAPAIVPLALWTGFIACRIMPSLKAKAMTLKILPTLIGIVYLSMLSAAVLITNRVLVKNNRTYPIQSIWLYDLAAIAKDTGQSPFPAYISNDPKFSLEKVSKYYTPEWINTLIFNCEPILKISFDPAEIAELQSKWWQAVLSNKLIYLQHRWNVFTTLIGFNTYYINKAVLPSAGYNPREYKRKPNWINE